jgi:hypothetical protein
VPTESRRGFVMAGFAKGAVDLSTENWEQIEKYNFCLDRLLARRKPEVAVVGLLIESKTAWKLDLLAQSLLHRICALARGTADAWNGTNVAASLILGRALMETVALTELVRDELLRLREPMNVAAANEIDALCNQQLFSTKDEKRIADGYGHMARNVLTCIDKFERKIPTIRETYDFLSEWAHPNASGHFFTFGEINKETGCVTFHESAPRIRGIQGHVIGCFMLIQFVEFTLDIFDETIPMVGEVDKGQGPWVPGAVAGLKAGRADPL